MALGGWGRGPIDIGGGFRMPPFLQSRARMVRLGVLAVAVVALLFTGLSRLKTSVGDVGGRSRAVAGCDRDCQEDDPASDASLDRPATGRGLVGRTTESRLTHRPTEGRLDLGQTGPRGAPVVVDGIRRRLPPAVTGLSENCPKTAADGGQLRATRAGEEGRFFVAFFALG